MLKSMTGYGKAEVIFPDKKVIIEIKSLNSKNNDTNVKMPFIYRDKELQIRQQVYDRLLRGKIDVTVYFDSGDGTTLSGINKDVFKTYYKEITELSKELGFTAGEGAIQAILRLPDTTRSAKNEADEDEWIKISEGIESAISHLDEFRMQEGLAMSRDLTDRVNSILSLLGEIPSFEENRIARIKERFEKNLAEIASAENIDRNRFEQEMIYYIERLDISEEKTRLQNHCEYFTVTMQSEEASGKKLAFISQEMGREINTLGSKASDSEIQRLVVMMKDELEKIKEQIANIL